MEGSVQRGPHQLRHARIEQLVLGCLGATEAPFAQGALVTFRERMIAHDFDRALLDRTVTLAKQTGHLGWQALRAALDSSPLVGRGRVESPRPRAADGDHVRGGFRRALA